MEGIEPLAVEESPATAPEVINTDSEAEIDELLTMEDVEVSKKRKDHPVPEEEALEEVSEGKPVRMKYPRLVQSVSPKSVSSKNMAEQKEEVRLRREEERRKREEDKLAERDAKRMAIEEAKRQKEAEKQKREDEKRQKEQAKEDLKRQKEAERLTKEEEKRQAKEAAEREKNEKEEERKRQKDAKDEEKRKKEEEREQTKRQKEEERKSKEAEKRAGAEKAQEAVKRQSNILMSFIKKTPTNSADTSFIGDEAEVQGVKKNGSRLQTDPLLAQFERVGMFLAWVPPQGAIIPRFQKWTVRATPEEFEDAVVKSSTSISEQEVRSSFEKWRTSSFNGKSRLLPPTHAELTEMRRTLYQHRIEFLSDEGCCTPSVEKQKKHLLEHRMKFLQIDQSFRPTFYGTFSTVSERVNGRNWRGKAEGIDYVVDSDEESFESIGEAEEDADDLEAGSDAEEDGEEHGDDGDGAENEYEFDAFVVPDGHLSDEEAHAGEDGEESDEEEIGPKERADRAALLAQTKRRLTSKPKLAQLTPTLIGPIHDFKKQSETMTPAMQEIFQSHAIRRFTLATGVHLPGEAVVGGSSNGGPISLLPASSSSSFGSGTSNTQPTVRKSTARVIPVELLPSVAAFIHKEWLSSFDKLLERARSEFSQAFSKKQLGRFIREKCEKVKLPYAKTGIWLVKRIHREAFGLPFDDPIPPTPTATSPLNLFTTKSKSKSNEDSNITSPTKKSRKTNSKIIVTEGEQTNSNPFIASTDMPAAPSTMESTSNAMDLTNNMPSS
jgi:hypothetical protein